METQSRITGTRKAAILLTLLGEDAASLIMRHLPEGDAQKIAEELVDLDNISSETAEAVLDECQRALSGGETARGGSEFAKQLLMRAYGDETGRNLLRQVSRLRESPGQFETLRKADPENIVKFLEGEHPQTLALIMAHLDPKQASLFLLKLPDDLRAEVVRRLANLRHFSPEIVQKISAVLETKLHALGDRNKESFAGLKGVAELMNRMHAPVATAILEAIEKEQPETAIGIRRLMFTFEDLLTVPEASIREWLGALDKKVLATALRGASEEVKNHIYHAMSSRAVEMLKEDIEALGPVRGRDVTKAQEDAIAIARKLEAEGKMVLKDEGDDEYVP